MNKELDNLLNFDSLKEAEKITGESYKKDDATGWLGMALMMENTKVKNKILGEMDDTKFSETKSEYLRKVTDFGFKTLVEIPFETEDKFNTGKTIVNETFYIMWHEEHSILLCWDTFNGDSRNGGNFYYNIASDNFDKLTYLTQNGGYIHHKDTNHRNFSTVFNKKTGEPIELPKEIRDVEPKYDGKDWEGYDKLSTEWFIIANNWMNGQNGERYFSGSHDCREAIKYTIDKMLLGGRFLKTWKEKPFLWLLHHGDTKKNYNYEKINAERLAMLPQDVQDKINGIWK